MRGDRLRREIESWVEPGPRCAECEVEGASTQCHDCGQDLHRECHETHVCPECAHCGYVLEDRYDQERGQHPECEYVASGQHLALVECAHDSLRSGRLRGCLNVRPWPESGLVIGECPVCRSTLSVEGAA